MVLLLSCDNASDVADITGSHNLRLKKGNEWVYYDSDLIGNYDDTTRNYFYVFRIVESGEMFWNLEDGNVAKMISFKSIDTLDKDNTDSWYYYTEYNEGIIIGKLKNRNNPQSEIVPQAFLPNTIKIGKRSDFGISSDWKFSPVGSLWPRITPTDSGNTEIKTSYINIWHCKNTGETDIPYFSLNSRFTFIFLRDTKIINDETGEGGLIINEFNY